MINEVQNEIDGSFRPCFKRTKPSIFHLVVSYIDTFLLIQKGWRSVKSVTAQASSISITSFVSQGVSFLIAQYMPSLRVKSNVCTNIICTHVIQTLRPQTHKYLFIELWLRISSLALHRLGEMRTHTLSCKMPLVLIVSVILLQTSVIRR